MNAPQNPTLNANTRGRGRGGWGRGGGGPGRINQQGLGEGGRGNGLGGRGHQRGGRGGRGAPGGNTQPGYGGGGRSKPTHRPDCGPHPNGEYWIRVRDVKDVYEGEESVVPATCYRGKGSDGWVSSRDVQQAFSAWDSDGQESDGEQPRFGLGYGGSCFGLDYGGRGGEGGQIHQGSGRGRGAGRSREGGKPTYQPDCPPHPNGEYWIRIRDVAEVHGHVCPIPAHLYARDSEHSYVSTDDVEYASDRWDAEGVLEDIDTQFGMFPEGGYLDVAGGGDGD